MAWGTRGGESDSLGHTCPRCDYDQCGEIARWTDSCPLRGVCSECGLAFDWVDVHFASRNLIPGFVEHEQRRRIIPAAWRTWWWALRPGRFWTMVRLEHRPKVTRMLMWIVLLILVPRLLLACAVAFIRWWGQMRAWPAGTFETLWDDVQEVLLDGFTAFAWHSSYDNVLTLPAGMVVFTTSVLAVPLVLMCLPWTRARAKVHRGHVARATAYSLAPLVALNTTWALAGVVWCAHRLLGPSQHAYRSYGETDYEYYWDYANFGERAKIVAGVVWTWGGWIAAAWLVFWWWSALSRGFRIAGAGRLTAVLMVCAVLAALVALALTHPVFAVSIFGEQ